MWKNILAAALLSLGSAGALAGSCPTLMHEVDQALADDAIVAELSESELQEVRELRERGESLHQSGRHGKSVEVLNEALDILGAGGSDSY